MTQTPKILLFDIDGTLLATRGAGRLALFSALQAEFSVTEPVELEFSGRTDRELLAGLLELSGQAQDEANMRRLREAYASRLSKFLHQTRGAILPGVLELLDQLRPRPEFRLGVLTGNLPETAEMKLRHFGLWDYFDLHFFGDQYVLRTELMGYAHDQLRSHYGELAGEQICIIGDTPLDIAAAQSIGAHCLATATGIYPFEELLRYGASRVVKNLFDTQDLLRWLGSL